MAGLGFMTISNNGAIATVGKTEDFAFTGAISLLRRFNFGSAAGQFEYDDRDVVAATTLVRDTHQAVTCFLRRVGIH